MEPQGNLDSDANAIVHRTTRKSREKIDKTGTKSERIYQLKRTRAGMKASVTKIRNKLQLLMSDYKNIDLVREKFNELNDSMKRFKDAHTKYHVEITNEYDIEESKEYYDSEETKVSQLVDKIVKWTDAEQRRIEHIIADYLSDSVLPEDSISNVSAHSALRNSKRLKNTSIANSNL
ncbi:MAG: hypothetical protein DSY43_01925, partial [Gammaproteobacteria bacterium]